MTDYKKLVEEGEERLQPLHSRMISDRGIYFLTPYKMKSYDNQTELKRVDNVTSRDPRNFADRIISVLNTAKLTAEVSSKKLQDKDANAIEAFWYLAEDRADRRLAKKMMMPVRPTNVFHACVSGWVGSRVWVWEDENGELVCDLLPLDPLFLTWQVGRDGLLWAAYKTMRGRELIEQEYGISITEKEAEITDLWNNEANVVLLSGETVKEVENPFGEVPFVIKPVALTPMVGTSLGDTSAFTNYGESIFSAMRNQEAEYNKFLSILQSLNAQHFRKPKGYRSQDGKKLPPPDADAAGAKTAMGPSEEWVDVPIGEVKESASLFYSIISGERQRSMLPYNDWGEVPFELSDLALARLERQRDQVVLPRKQTLTEAYSEMAMMMLRQFQKGGFGAVKLDVKGEEIDFRLPGELPADLNIEFHLETVSPEKDISNYSVAAAAKNVGVPQDIIMRNILRIDDPQAARDKALEEWAVEAVPALKLYRAGRMFSQRAEELKGDEGKEKEIEAELIFQFIEEQFGAQVGEGDERERPSEVPGQTPTEVKSLKSQMRRKGMEEAK